MSKRTLTVTVDEQTFTRTTDASYTHVLVCRGESVNVVQWSKSEKNARAAKSRAEANKFNKTCTFEVVPVSPHL